MKNKIKISFIMAAHNEERIIKKALDNLLNLPYENYEVIIGLDGCTDRTEEIVKFYVKKSGKFKYFNLNLRQGKTKVITNLIKKASGEIIIIHDADWIFNVKSRKDLEKFISVFNNPNIGGIAESFPIQYPLKKKAGILEVGVMIQNKIWIDYLKKKGAKLNDDWIVADKNSSLLLVNIFRKKLYRTNKTLADDFERFRDISNFGKNIVVTNNSKIPRMVSAESNYKFKELIRQKERTALARKQLGTMGTENSLSSFNFFGYVLRQTFKMNLREVISFFLVNLAFLLGTIKSKFRNNISTREGWKMRLTR